MSTSLGRHFFISYSRTDTKQKQNIVKQLRARGINLWVDIENLVPGTPAWEQEIERAIRGAAGIIVLLSPESNNSEWVRREISFAEQNDKYLFPVLIRGNEDESIPLRLSNHQRVDLRTKVEHGLDELADALKHYADITAVRREIKQQAKEPFKLKSEDLRKIALPGLLALVGLLFIGGFVIWGSFIRNTSSPSAAASTSQTFDPAVTATTSEFLNDVQILYSDTFNEPGVSQWNVNAGIIENGVMELIGNQDWSFSYWNGNLGVNEGVVLAFNYSDVSLSEIFLEYGTWNTDTYKRFGVYIGGGQAKLNGYRGKEDQDYGGANLSGNLTLQPDTTYALLIAVLPDGEFLEVIWDPSNPAETLSHRERIDETWGGLTWTLWVGVNQGTIKIDEFSKISFSSTK